MEFDGNSKKATEALNRIFSRERNSNHKEAKEAKAMREYSKREGIKVHYVDEWGEAYTDRKSLEILARAVSNAGFTEHAFRDMSVYPTLIKAFPEVMGLNRMDTEVIIEMMRGTFTIIPEEYLGYLR